MSLRSGAWRLEPGAWRDVGPAASRFAPDRARRQAPGARRYSLQPDLPSGFGAAVEGIQDRDHVQGFLGRDRRGLAVGDGVGEGDAFLRVRLAGLGVDKLRVLVL